MVPASLAKMMTAAVHQHQQLLVANRFVFRHINFCPDPSAGTLVDLKFKEVVEMPQAAAVSHQQLAGKYIVAPNH